jgi:hypothetical protein
MKFTRQVTLRLKPDGNKEVVSRNVPTIKKEILRSVPTDRDGLRMTLLYIPTLERGNEFNYQWGGQ